MTSESTKDVDKVVQAACDAAVRGDAAKVMTRLDSRPVAGVPIGLDEPLLPISALAQYLLENTSGNKFHSEHALRALVSIPSCYETPWRAALQFINALYSGDLASYSDQVVMTCVTDIQTFLQLTVEAWWKQESQRTKQSRSPQQNVQTTHVTPRHLLKELVDAILKPIHEAISIDNKNWALTLELIISIVSSCQDLEDTNGRGTTLADHVLNRLFPTHIRPDRLLPWLMCASDLRCHLQNKHWTRLYDILKHGVTQQIGAIPSTDLSGIVRGIVSLLVKQHQNHDRQEEQEWECLFLYMLYSASRDETTYSTVERELKSSLASLPNAILIKFLKAAKDANDVPDWIHSNISLLLLQAAQQSGSHDLVSSMVARALGTERGGDGGGDTQSLKRQCWESLKELVFVSSTDKNFPQNKQQRQNSTYIVAVMRTTLDGVCYEGSGQFMKDGDDTASRNISSKLAFQSIFLGELTPTEQSEHNSVAERAQSWLQAADSVLRSSLDANGADLSTNVDVLFAIMILVTVYCEVPECRSTVVRTTMQCLSGKDSYTVSDDDVSSYYCTMVAVIVRSISRQGSRFNDGVQELYPLTDVFEEPLANDVFYDLTTALVPLQQARSALLSASRKYLQSSFGGNLWWNMGSTTSRGMQETRGKVDCALYGLCKLISASESQLSRDDCRLEAWAILSEVIVLNKPALPMSERSSLFRRLTSFTEQSKFSLDTIDHLLRASLVRLLQFYDGNVEDSVELIPDRVLVLWGSSNNSLESDAPVGQREDIVGLLRFAMTLLEKQATLSDRPAKFDLCRGREQILEILGGDVEASNSIATRKDPQDVVMTSEEPSPRVSLESDIVSSCLAGVLRSALLISNIRTQTAEVDQERIKGRRIVERWQERLILAEIEACKDDCEMEGDLKSLFCWLKLSSPESAGTIIHSTVCDSVTRRRLLSALCDIVFDFVFHPIQPSGGTKSTEEDRLRQKRKLTKCVTFLFTVKRDLSIRDGETKVHEYDIPELFFDSTTLSVSTVPFLELCSDSVITSISKGNGLRDIEDTVVSLLAYCHALKDLGCHKGTSGWILEAPKKLQIVRQLWKLYLVVGDEKSARGLVGYLEEQGVAQLKSKESIEQLNNDKVVAQVGSELDENPSKHSFLTIRTDDDVDAIVQHVRLSIVSTMDAWLESLSKSNVKSSVTTNAGIFQDLPSQTDKNFHIALWLDVLRQLSSDTKAGLDGHSGGMTEALYNAYLSLIEGACRLVSLEMPQETDISSLSRAPIVALECSTYLKQVLCNFPLKGATQFKKTMALAMSELPSIQWEANLMLAISEKERPLLSTDDFAIDVFYQMVEIAERYHRLGRSRGNTWADIAGIEHFDATMDDADTDDSMNRVDELDGDSSVDGSFLGVPSLRVVDIKKKGNENQTSSLEQKDKKIQLPSQESWLWATCCSLSAMERIWATTYSILNGNMSCLLQTAPSSPPSFGPYCLERTKALSDTLRAACFAMKSLEELKNASAAVLNQPLKKKKKAAVILAATLADAVKVKLCSLLETISTALQVALRSVSNEVKTGDGVDDVVRAESMACMSAWLAVEEDELDIESLSKRWYNTENKRNNAKSKASGGAHKRLSPTLKRLPKFLVCAQELEADLSKFYQVLVQMEDDKTIAPQRQQTLDRYESLLYTQAENETSLQSMIKTKLNSLAKARAFSSAFNLKLPGKVNGSPAAPPKRSRKAPSLEHQMRQEKRRKAKRSRNKIVDEWMHLDDEHERDEGYDDDAYVDLEDFIV